jgi:hypothetical protein
VIELKKRLYFTTPAEPNTKENTMFFRLITLIKDIHEIFADAHALRTQLTRKYGMQAE